MLKISIGILQNVEYRKSRSDETGKKIAGAVGVPGVRYRGIRIYHKF